MYTQVTTDFGPSLELDNLIKMMLLLPWHPFRMWYWVLVQKIVVCLLFNMQEESFANLKETMGWLKWLYHILWA
jgi:hypothetical protein